MSFKTIDDLGDIAGQSALVRVDLNVPFADGRVTDETRMRAIVPTVKALSEKGAKVLLLAHFGRPEGAKHSELSLSMIIERLEEVIGKEIMFVPEIAGDVVTQSVGILRDGDIAVLENTRFFPGEEANDAELAKAVAANGDFFVNDAFSAAHRAHMSTEGLARILPSYAGRAMEAELTALEAALGDPTHPVAAVVGGAKVSTKLDVLTNLVRKVDHLIIGGGMANTFLAARGVNVGKSLCEHDLIDTANQIFEAADKADCTIHLPYDVVTSREFRSNAPTRTVNVHEVADDEMILDIGPAAVESLGDVLKNCRTLVWNGPLGAFEMEPFDAATVSLAKMAAALTKDGSMTSVAGGGDTVAALAHAGVAEDFSFVSAAGGAFLEWMEGKPLPGVEALKA